MNEIISLSDTCYKKRRMASMIGEMAEAVMVIIGARQVGKSTMFLNEFSNYYCLTLDDFNGS